MNMENVWFIWSLISLGIWLIIYMGKPNYRKGMLKMSLITMPFGLTEPLFVPEYWFPPSLFNLAQKTGFDIESFIFSFAIGGIGTVLYQLVYTRDVVDIPRLERDHASHRLHRYILFVPLLVFALLAYFTSLNHIYCGILAMFIGALATLYCRPDLKGKIWVGGLLITLLYFIYFGSILVFYPDYVQLYWNLGALSEVFVAGVPLEELLFAFTFGMLWSSLYEHMYWLKLAEQTKGKVHHASKRVGDQICLLDGKSHRAIGFINKIWEGINWARSYFTYDKGSRLIIRKYSRQGAEKTSRIEKIETR